MTKKAYLIIPAILGLSLYVQTAVAQDNSGGLNGDAILVFMDCKAPNCDYDHFRREIEWVNWANDRVDSDVHLLVTSQRTGGGGYVYTLDFIGQGESEDVTKSLTFTSENTDTDAEIREVLTRTIKLGLINYVEQTSIADRLEISYKAPDAAVEAPDSQADDPWNLWTFRISANGSIQGEASQSGFSARSSFSAARVTEAMKINFNASGRYSRDEFEFEEGDSFINTSESFRGTGLVVWSLTDHWSAGWSVEAHRSTFSNHRISGATGPRLEYDIFPYDESTRRLVTLRYGLEVARFDYLEETILGKFNEVLPRHQLAISASVQQPWGRIHGSITGEQYFHDLATHIIDTFAIVEYRLFRGFSINLFGSVARIKDQFYLPKEDLTDEEVLLKRQQRETNFQYYISAGISYRFGSKFSNIVNPRIGGGGGDIMIFY